MKPQRAPEGQLRRIVGFRLDENLDWVAKLECGHQLLVRQNPGHPGRTRLPDFAIRARLQVLRRPHARHNRR